jgi:MFS transporter, MHS family, proline/betaine transporter
MLIGIVILVNVADYIILSYMPSYLTETLDIGDTSALMAIVLTMVIMMAVITPVGALTDRVGRKPVMLAGCIGFALLTYPAFLLLSLGSVFGTIAGLLILGLLLVLILGTIGSMLPALFPTKYRYGAFCIGYNISTSAFGGTAPFVATYLISVTGDNFVPAYYLIVAALIAFVPILMAEETAGTPLKQLSDAPARPAGATLRQ